MADAMADTSIGYAIQEALRKLMVAANLPGIAEADIAVRAMPKVGESIDRLPCLRIAPYGDDDSVPLSFEGCVDRIYSIEITLIDAIEADLQSGQNQYQGWKEKALKKIEKDNDGFLRDQLDDVPSVWDLDIIAAPNFDRSKLAANYAYQGILVEVHSRE
jgi:hypothetical protein